MSDFVDKAEAWDAITNKNGKIAKLCDDIARWKESDSLMQCRIDDLKAENERLRNLWIKAEAQIPPEGSYDELVELERLRARCAELEKALEPFAAEAPKWDAFDSNEPLVETWNEGPDTNLIVADLRFARATLQGQDNGR